MQTVFFLSLLKNGEHSLGALFSGGFLDGFNTKLYRAGAEANLDNIAQLYLVRGAGGLAVDRYSATVTSLVGDGSALDYAGHLKVFI